MRPYTNEECYQALLDDYIELENKYEDLKEEYKDLKEKNKSNEAIIEFLQNENDELYQKTKKLEVALKRSEKEWKRKLYYVLYVLLI